VTGDDMLMLLMVMRAGDLDTQHTVLWK